MNTSFSEKQLFWSFVVMIFVILFFGAVFYFVNLAKGGSDGVFNGLEDKLYETRLLYSPKCFAFQDPNSLRTYTGTINMAQFDEATLNKCTQLTNPDKRAIMVELVYADSSGKISATVLKTKNWDEKTGQKELVAHNYAVNIIGLGSGNIRFIHRY